MTRPLIRKQGVWWRIFIGQSTHTLNDYYTSAARAADAARQINITEVNR